MSSVDDFYNQVRKLIRFNTLLPMEQDEDEKKTLIVGINEATAYLRKHINGTRGSIVIGDPEEWDQEELKTSLKSILKIRGNTKDPFDELFEFIGEAEGQDSDLDAVRGVESSSGARGEQS